MSDKPTPLPPPPPPSGIYVLPPRIVSTPDATEEEKPETLFIRCSVVVIGVFVAASVLNVIVFVALILDRKWGLLGGEVNSMPLFVGRNGYEPYLPLVASGILIQLAWWITLTFWYICGKYDQVAEKYGELKWFNLIGLITTPSGFSFTLFPVGFILISLLYATLFFLLASVGVWVWNLVF